MHMITEISTPNFYKYLDINGSKLTLQNQAFRHSKPSDFIDKEDMTAISVFPYDDIKTTCIEIQNSIADCLTKNLDRNPTCKGQIKSDIQRLQALFRQPNAPEILKKTLQKETVESFFDINHLTEFSNTFISNINEF